jgi:biofilm protein TabA
MIIDTFKNIDLYKTMSLNIWKGLVFLEEAKPELEVGIYTINESVKAIVEEYTTSFDSSELFESHKHVIDIQYPVAGLERVLWSPINEMVIEIPYNLAQDSTYFSGSFKQATHADIGEGVYAIFFEGDGHSPKHCVAEQELIKKVTIKVAVDHIFEAPKTRTV